MRIASGAGSRKTASWKLQSSHVRRAAGLGGPSGGRRGGAPAAMTRRQDTWRPCRSVRTPAGGHPEHADLLLDPSALPGLLQIPEAVFYDMEVHIVVQQRTAACMYLYFVPLDQCCLREGSNARGWSQGDTGSEAGNQRQNDTHRLSAHGSARLRRRGHRSMIGSVAPSAWTAADHDRLLTRKCPSVHDLLEWPIYKDYTTNSPGLDCVAGWLVC